MLCLVRSGSGSGAVAESSPSLQQYREAQYKEMQVHGEIVLARDVEAIVLVGIDDHETGKDLAVEFGRKFGVAVIMQRTVS